MSFRSRCLPLISLLLLLVLLVASAGAQVSFKSSSIGTGALPSKVISADFNKDGIADLATTNEEGNSISIALGNGDGTFRAHTDYATGSKPIAPIAVDLNGDGLLDLAVINSGSNTVSVLLGNGDGSFRAKHDYPVGAGANSLVAGDFNSDGRQDLATANGTANTISLLLGLGDGSFSATKSIAAGAISPHSLVRGDFNKDGRADLAFIDCCGGVDVELDDIYVLTSNGDGTFTSKVIGQISGARELAVTDWNRDGRSDIAATYSGCHTPCSGVAVLLNTTTGFTVKNVISTDTDIYGTPRSPVFGDFNGDGISDVAVLAQNITNDPWSDHVLVWLMDSTGAVKDSADFALGAKGATSLTRGDFNRDKRNDLAVAESATDQIALLRNNTGLSGSTPCAVPTEPRVKICTPAAMATVSSAVDISAAGQGYSPLARLEVWVDGSKRFQTTSPTLHTTLTLTAGPHKLTVQAVDIYGTTIKQTETFIVGSVTAACTAPTTPGVNICSPASGATVASPVGVAAAAKTSATLLRTELWVDGVKKFQTATASLNTSVAMASGARRISVQALDSAGAVVKKTIYITVP